MVDLSNSTTFEAPLYLIVLSPNVELERCWRWNAPATSDCRGEESQYGHPSNAQLNRSQLRSQMHTTQQAW